MNTLLLLGRAFVGLLLGRCAESFVDRLAGGLEHGAAMNWLAKHLGAAVAAAFVATDRHGSAVSVAIAIAAAAMPAPATGASELADE